MLGCQADVDITWSFEDCTGGSSVPCGVSQSANVPFGGSITIPCQQLACPMVCELIITITGVNGGCAVGPTSIKWSDALANGGKAFSIITCNTTPSCGNCCDSGNSIGIDINNGFAWVN